MSRIFDALKIAPPEGHRTRPIFSTRDLSVAVTVHPGATILMELGNAGDGKVVATPKAKEKKNGEPTNAERRVFVFVTAKIIKPVVAEKSVTITSDSIGHDKATGTVTARGNVSIETPQAVITTDKAEFKARQPAKTK